MPKRIFVPLAGGVTHSATGALAAGSAIVVGTAAHIAIHGSSGALAAGSAIVVGTAAHIAIHGSSGALAAGSAIVAGTASRSGQVTLTQADIDAIADAVWNHPKALTVAKFLGLK